MKINPAMSKTGPLILVDDDLDDQESIIASLNELVFKNDIKCFQNAEAALEYLYAASEQPFMIISDINMPGMNGITFKKTIDSCEILKSKCIPFVFLSTSTDLAKKSYNLNIQGFFEKGNSLQAMNETLKIILRYWERTKHVQ
jgi:two-component SAPR family response regulator